MGDYSSCRDASRMSAHASVQHGLSLLHPFSNFSRRICLAGIFHRNLKPMNAPGQANSCGSRNAGYSMLYAAPPRLKTSSCCLHAISSIELVPATNHLHPHLRTRTSRTRGNIGLYREDGNCDLGCRVSGMAARLNGERLRRTLQLSLAALGLRRELRETHSEDMSIAYSA